MKVWLIGNGFDVALGLPTKYTEFLEFIKYALLIENEPNTKVSSIGNYKNKKHYEILGKTLDNIEDEDVKRKRMWVLVYVNVLIKNKKIREDVIMNIRDNYLVSHFLCEAHELGDTWKGFEDEIFHIINELSKERECIETGSVYSLESMVRKILYNHEKVRNNNKPFLFEYEKLNKLKEFDKFIDKLETDLNRLINALDIYLKEIVMGGQTGRTELSFYIWINTIMPELIDEGMQPDYILNFNYTDTFNRLSICKPLDDSRFYFIHGRISTKDNYQNIVLGAADNLTSGDKNTKFIGFKKYYQRILKSTGIEYKQWISKCKENSDNFDLYVYGHSLSENDAEITNELMLIDGVKTTIFYHNEKSKRDIIENLVKNLTRDVLIEKYNNGSIVLTQTRKCITATKMEDYLSKLLNDKTDNWRFYLDKIVMDYESEVKDYLNDECAMKRIHNNFQKVIELAHEYSYPDIEKLISLQNKF